MIRAPLLPIKLFLNKLSKITRFTDLLPLYKSSPEIQEALLIANPNLHYLIENIEGSHKKSKNQILHSLYNYFLRSTSRATPFGLFASVGLGHFTCSTSIEIPTTTKIKKKIRPDMEWVFKLIDDIKENKKTLPKFKVKINNSLVFSGGRIFHHGFYNFKTKSYELMSIKDSSIIRYIIKLAHEWVSLEKIEHLLTQKFNHLDNKEINNLLTKLYNEQFLISELYPDLLVRDPSEFFLEKLHDKDVLDGKIYRNLITLIRKYNSNDTEDQSSTIKDIRNVLKSCLKADLTNKENFIQVDASFHNNGQTIHNGVSSEAVKVANFLYRWSSQKHEERPIDLYHTQFLEKFGSESMVPFLDLIDDHLGLGIPSFQVSPPYSTDSSWDKSFLYKCQHAGLNRETEVTISEEEAEMLEADHSELLPPVSASFICEIFSDSPSSIDKGEFNLCLSGAQIQGSATAFFGRFTHILPVSNEVIQTHKQEKNLEPESLFVELSWQPHEAKLNNVAFHENFRDFSLSVPGSSNINNKISINDIFVGTDTSSLFLFSKKHQKRLIFKSNNALNQNLAPPFVQLLHQISNCNIRSFKNFYLRPNSTPYFPRIKYSKTFLTPASWNIQLSFLDPKHSLPKNLLIKKVELWLKSWLVPRYIYINPSYTDQTLLLDTSNPTHIEQISKVLKEEGQVFLYEKISLKGCQWATGSEGSYLTEIVIPLIRRQVNPFKVPHLKFQDQDKLTTSSRKDWIYLKLYISKERQNNFLINHLLPFILQKNYLDWFFVRYQDPKDHIRLRVRPQKDDHEQSFKTIQNWAFNLNEQGNCSSFSFHPYFPEVERYGGSSLINKAEKIFGGDSITAISLLYLSQQNDLSLVPVAVLSIINFLMYFCTDLNECISLLKQTYNQASKLDGFRKHKSWISKQLQESLWFNKNPLLQEESSMLHESFSFRKQATQKYKKELETIETLPQSEKYKILNSFIHMHCNRLGIFPEEEEKVRFYTLKTISAEVQKKNYSRSPEHPLTAGREFSNLWHEREQSPI